MRHAFHGTLRISHGTLRYALATMQQLLLDGDAVFSPASIAGLVGWWDFSDISTLYQDASKTTPVASDGDVIGAVQDKSGNGNDFTQGNADLKPLYKTNIQNGLSMGRFDGTDDYLYRAAGLNLSQPHETWIVSKNYHDMDAKYWYDRPFMYYSYNYSIRIYSGVYLIGWAHPDPIIFYARYNGVDSEIYVHGSSYSGNAGTGTGDFNFLGKRSSGGPLDGDIGEFYVFDGQMSSADRTLVEAYINDKWSIY